MIDEENWYLNVKREGSRGALTFNLSLPQFDTSDYQKLSFYIGPNERKKMSGLFKGATQVITYINGACNGNPGPSGAGIAFYDRENYKEKFLFGVKLHLGHMTNNMAVYSAHILA